MKVGFFGNVANSLFHLGLAIRTHSDLDIHLCLGRTEEWIRRPEADYPELAGALPDWVHEVSYEASRPSLRMVAAPWRSAVRRDLATCDALVVNGLGPLFAQFVGKPWAFLSTGGDLTVMPFPWRFRGQARSARGRIGRFALAPWQRRAIRRASEIWVQPFGPFSIALDRLRVDQRRVSSNYLPFPLDTRLFSPEAPTGPLEPAIAAALDDCDFMLFHPSRLMIRPDRPMRDSGQWKANDVLIRGFAEFVRRGIAKRPRLVLPERTVSPDVALARQLIDELGIAKQVAWIRPENPEGFNRHQLISLYRRADAVADDFGIGWFGAVVLEGLAMSKPVISYIDGEAMRKMYPWHPILSTREPVEIADRLGELATNVAFAQEIGARGRAWMEEFHAFDAVAPKYADAIRSLATHSHSRR